MIDATKPYRKGEVVRTEQVGSVKVVTIDAFPQAPELAMTVDTHFLEIGFTEAAAISHREFYDMIIAAVEWSVASRHPYAISLDDLRGGPSYRNLGAWLGDQTLAFCYLALGELHKLWKVVTPERLGASGEMAAKLAGDGYIFQGGLKEPEVVT